jgi:FlaA1/EpsC-like NDP-sugar epimerase
MIEPPDMTNEAQPVPMEHSGHRPGLRLLRQIGIAVNRLPQWTFSRTVQFAIDAVLTAFAIVTAFAIRFDGNIPAVHVPHLWLLLAALPILRALTIRLMRGHRMVWRYFSLRDEMLLVASALPCTLLLLVIRYTLAPEFWFAQIPAGVILIEFGAFVMLATAIRVFRRLTSEAVGEPLRAARALVIGTGESLAAAIRHLTSYTGIKVIGLLSVEDYLSGLVIGGYPVIGTVDHLSRLLADRAIDLVLVSDAGLSCIGSVVETATEFDVNIRLLPSAANVLRGHVRVSASVSPDGVVGRSPARSQVHPSVIEAYRGRRVLVTGAGGSIGSELCRQLSQLPIDSLILLDRDENSIFEVSAGLNGAGPATIVPLVRDIRDTAAMSRVFETYRPQKVLHAAAYKHVPLMEQNCSEAVLNNVVGTRELLEHAFAFRTESFLMISTDKAVHPASIMGATKKVAEQLVQLMGRGDGNHEQPRCSCVRFGNVVGSRGSVVPIFLRQIAAGGPITITDENMTRYFMTIPEAVRLVLQASTFGSCGDIYMLDMGNPVKITTMARKLIEMSGLRADKDISTTVVGVRPGEKLHEELWSQSAQVLPTEVSGLLSVRAPAIHKDDFFRRLAQLEQAARIGDDVLVRRCLHEMPIDFQQSDVGTVAARNGE